MRCQQFIDDRCVFPLNVLPQLVVGTFVKNNVFDLLQEGVPMPLRAGIVFGEAHNFFYAIDRKTRSINLSIKAKDQAEQHEAMQKFSAESSVSSGTTNLGALLKAKLNSQQ